MIYLRKHRILENLVTVCDYDFILDQIVRNRKYEEKNLLVCPIASQTLVLAKKDKKLRNILDDFDYIVPCSEWVKRSINFLYGTSLKRRVYGPNLMLKICALASNKGLKIFLYGTTFGTVAKLSSQLKKLFPKISIVGVIPSKFAPLTLNEKNELIERIEKSKADILFIGEGSPIQEVFTHDLFFNTPSLREPIVAVTVGASFDFISKVKPQAPTLLQNFGLEWFFRLMNEPMRLWRRYLILGPAFIILVMMQKVNSLNFTDNVVIKNKTRG